MTPNFRTRRTVAVLVVVVAVMVALPRFLTHTPYQRLGAGLSPATGAVERIVGPPAKGLLREGDRVVRVDTLDFTDPAARAHLREKGWPRGPLEVEVDRAGRVLTLVLPPVQLSAWERLRIFTYPIAAVIAAPLVAFLLVWRRPDLGTAWAFLWFATLEALAVVFGLYQYPQSEGTPGFRFYLRVYEVLVWLYPASFLHFMSVFPRPRWSAATRSRSAWFWITAASYGTGLLLMSATIDLPPREPNPAFAWFQLGCLVLGIASLVERYSRSAPGWAPTRRERSLALLIALALLLGSSLNMLGSDPRLASLLPYTTMRVLFTIVFIAWLSTPLLIAWLIAEDAAFDPRRLVVRGIPYALVSGLLASLYLGVVLAGQRVFASLTGEQALVFNVVAALIVAFAFAPLRDGLQRTIDRGFGRDPRLLRVALDGAGRELLSALDRAEVRGAVEHGLARGLLRDVQVVWPDGAPPRLVDVDAVPEDARAAVDNLLVQAGIRLENLALGEQRAASERQAVEMREAITLAELRALQAQVQPHFLFNALNALAYLIETDPMAASRFTGRLADMLRYTVEAGKRPAVQLSEEIGFVEDYLGVARERYDNPLHFRFRGDAALLSMGVPPLLLQPLVENSLKHGLAAGGVSLRMTLDARVKDGWVEMEFADDGLANGHGGPGLGVGIENLEQRLRRFAGGEAFVSTGQREAGGYAVRMRWPGGTGGER